MASKGSEARESQERSPETDLIIGAAGVGEGPPGRPDLDWLRLERWARDQGVLALVARHLKATGWEGVPEPVVASLTAYRTGLMARNVLLTRQLLAILAVLEQAGIRALPYKGPLLAEYAYGDLGLRPFSDLDLIVSERDVLGARDHLCAAGYESLTPHMDQKRPGHLPRGYYALPLRRPQEQVAVELHWRLAPTFPLTMEHLDVGTEAFPLLGSSVPSLSLERTLLVLCVHGGKHAWERLEWICAVAHVIKRRPGLDWERLAGDAQAVGAGRSVALGLTLAASVGRADVPEEALRELRASRVEPVARQIRAGLCVDFPQTGRTVRMYSLSLKASTVADRVRYLLYLRHPTERDRSFLALPSHLSFLYLVVRPLRLAHDHRPLRAWQERADRRRAQRALERQLTYQERKAQALQGREDEVIAAIAERWARVQRLIRRVATPHPDPRILEVGSGAHGLVFGSGSALAVGADPLAVDYLELFPGWQRRVPTVAALGDRLPFASGSFDLVLCDNVVDHAEAPAAIVAELARVLAPGGLLYFSVNVHHGLYSAVSTAHRMWRTAGIPLEIGPFADHTVHLTPEHARRLFDGLPLAVVDERVYRLDPAEQARTGRLRPLRHLVLRLFFKNARFEVTAGRR